MIEPDSTWGAPSHRRLYAGEGLLEKMTISLRSRGQARASEESRRRVVLGDSMQVV